MESLSEDTAPMSRDHDFISRIVSVFLYSNLSALLIVFSVLVGLAALLVTPREEDPQIIVPVADVFVNFPGHSAKEVEQLVATPLERVLYQIDGVEYVYSLSRENQAIITVRFYVGEDRERSLVKLFKKIDENLDIVPPGVEGWVVKPVEIDDVPIVTLTLTGSDSYTLRRIGEEVVERLAAINEVSRAYVLGGEPRTVRLELDTERMRGYNVSPLEVQRAIRGANVTVPAGEFSREDAIFRVDAGRALARPDELLNLVVGVWNGRPVFLKDIATLHDGPAEITSYVHHGWGPGRNMLAHPGSPGTLLGAAHHSISYQSEHTETHGGVIEHEASPAVTLALSKKKGTNAVTVANQILQAAEKIHREYLPEGLSLIVTRNSGLTADEKVNELIEALAVAVVIVVALLTLSLGWREAFIVAVAVPVVFGLTLAVNLASGYTINRVTLFALILSIGLLVDDPIVDVENISRHFRQAGRATRDITLAAVAEIRPPLISATLAVIVSFLPLSFITGMMGPYMAPMALNVPVAMIASMVVAFTITPWLTFHMLRGHFGRKSDSNASDLHGNTSRAAESESNHHLYDPVSVQRSLLYHVFRPMMAPLLTSRLGAWLFLLVMTGLTVAAIGLAAARYVPLKMLPFDNKNELLILLDFDEGTTLERSRAAVQQFEAFLATVPEVTDYTSYVGTPGAMDFNGMVRHYYLRQAPHLAEIRVNLVGKKNRHHQSHAIALRLRDELTRLADLHGAALKIVELPPGPPVLASIVAEVYGRADHQYEELLDVADRVADRLGKEPGIADVDSIREAPVQKLIFVTDQEKAALAGVSVAEIAQTIRLALHGNNDQTIHVAEERHPLRIMIRLPRAERSSAEDLGRLHIKGANGTMVPLAELGRWQSATVDQTIYHKNLERVAYVFAETVGRPPAECVADIVADRRVAPLTPSVLSPTEPRPLATRTYFRNGGGIPWAIPDGFRVDFSGEGELKITLDVFRDLGLAFAAAMLMIYVILVAQTGSFVVPIIVMLAIPLTFLGVLPGFWLLNLLSAQTVGGYADPVFFTATAMIGMIAMAGIVTRDSIILVDFIHLAQREGRSLFDVVLESRVVRLRPILLTASTAMLAAVPITIDPIFSGLGWSLIFGLFASTVFTMFVIPVCYWLVYATEKDKAQVSHTL
jgi:multidrug efflux pump subunit AcrB